MIIQLDSREKPKAIKNIITYFEQQGIKYYISKLLVGDYMNLDNPKVIVDRKQNMTEVYSNLIQDHTRFTNEIKLAQQCSIRLIFLIEHGEDIQCIDDVMKWENPQNEKYRQRIKTILSKLNLTQKFCKYSIEELLILAKDNNVKIPKPPAPNEQLIKSMYTLTERYGCEFQFCNKCDTGKRIIEILGGNG